MLDNDIRQTIVQVQQGQESLREGTIKKYIPFILKAASRTCKRYVRYGVDDEVSIALMAFNEAITKYDTNQNGSFFSFAENVIRRRIIDYFRKNKTYSKEIPLSLITEEHSEQEYSVLFDKMTWEKVKELHFEEEINDMRRQEILAYQRKLGEYGITLNELVQISPKHHDARCTAFKIAKIICHDENLLTYLQTKKALPLKDLEEKVAVSRKTMERQRKYIIALSIIMMNRFYFLEEYLNGLKG